MAIFNNPFASDTIIMESITQRIRSKFLFLNKPIKWESHVHHFNNNLILDKRDCHNLSYPQNKTLATQRLVQENYLFNFQKSFQVIVNLQRPYVISMTLMRQADLMDMSIRNSKNTKPVDNTQVFWALILWWMHWWIAGTIIDQSLDGEDSYRDFWIQQGVSEYVLLIIN